MCGISGFYSTNKKRIFTKQQLVKFTDAISHRGPDADGYYIDKNEGIYFGHRRLRIIDLSTDADQPMKSSDSKIIIVFNGEILNYKELKEKLKKYKFKSNSDTEVIINGYLEHGTEIFSKLDGFFAIALYDCTKKCLYLVRDRLGKKPLYYSYEGGNLIFSSEAKSFLKNKDLLKNIDLDDAEVKKLFEFQYLYDNEKTIIKGINKVKPGTYLKFSNSKIKEKTYWKLGYKKFTGTYEEALKKTEELLIKAIEKRVNNCDVNQGVFLSGGLDSSTVAAIAAKIKGKEKIKTFTAVSSAKMDERSFADLVANHIGSEHTQVEMLYPDIVAEIDEIIETYDDMSSFDPGTISERLLAKQIRKKGITVVLVGEGADEVFGGYSWYGLSKFPFNLLPSRIRSSLYYYIVTRRFKDSFFSTALNNFHRTLNSYNGGIFDQIANFEITKQLPNHFNMKVDKGNMAYGIEARSPYLDYELVSFVYSLPDEYKLKGKYFNFSASWEKRILRDIAKKYLPKNIYNRKKYGFMLSMIDTIEANRDYVNKRILKNIDLLKKYLPKKYIEWVLRPSNNRIEAKEKEFMQWRLLLFSVWYDKYFKN